jgi:hypothetical protein
MNNILTIENNSEAKGYVSSYSYEILKFVDVIICLEVFFKCGDTQIFMFGIIPYFFLIYLYSCLTRYTTFRKLSLFLSPRESL